MNEKKITKITTDIDWKKQEIHMLKNLKAEIENMEIKPYIKITR